MNKRKTIGKKLRFEVFKRDGFTCQYCGSKAPSVILHVDHINPVSKGGGNDILNLVTSCQSCNSGKGARALTDNEELAAQRKQLDDLNERRQQLEWMLEWREQLGGLEEKTLSAMVEEWSKFAMGWTINDKGKASLMRWEKTFGLEMMLDAIKASATQYLEIEDGIATSSSVSYAFNMIPRVAGGMKKQEDRPYLRDLYYVRAVLRNRIYVDETRVFGLLEQAITLDIDVDWLKQYAKTVRNWTNFVMTISDFIEKQSGEE